MKIFKQNSVLLYLLDKKRKKLITVRSYFHIKND